MELALDRNKIKVHTVTRLNALDYLIFIFMFLSTLLIGADVIGINVGINLRLDQIFLIITTFLMIVRNRYKYKNNKWIILFAIFSLISVLTGFNLLRGVLYYFSIIYNIIFIFYLYYNFVLYYGPRRFLRIFRQTMYIQFFLLLLQFGLMMVFNYEIPFMPSYGEFKGIHRFSLWFYEPSYFATYVSIWLCVSLYFLLIVNKKGFILDVIFSLIMLVISTSTSGFVAIALTFAIIYLLWILKSISLKKLLFLLFVIIAAIVFRVVFDHLYTLFINRLFTSSLDSSTGGRVSMWLETFEVFKEKPWFGVGPGNYGLYLGFDTAYVPSNVTLDLMATLGIFATIAFYALSLSLLYNALKVYKQGRKKFKILPAFCLALIVFTIILQVNQGYLRLYHWMLFGILYGLIAYYKKALRREYILKKKLREKELQRQAENNEQQVG